MKTLGRLFQLIGTNAAVLCLLLFVTNLASWAFLDLAPAAKNALLVHIDKRWRSEISPNMALDSQSFRHWQLPNYTNKDRAIKIFQDLTTLRVRYADYKPYVGWSRSPISLDTVTINSEGDRTNADSEKVLSTAATARFFGGSTMFGTGSDNNGTIPAAFNRLAPELRVHNHGEASFVSRQGLARLASLLGQNKKTDLVVFYDGVNDVANFCKQGMPLTGHRRAAEIARRVKQSEAIGYAMYTVFLKQSVRLMWKIKARLIGSPDVNFTCSTDPARAQSVAEAMINNWKMAHSLVTNRGGTFIALLQPVAYLGSARTEYVQPNMNNVALSAEYKAVYPRVQSLMKQYRYMHDLTDSFDGTEYIYIDFAHVSQNGNEIIARKINDLFLYK